MARKKHIHRALHTNGGPLHLHESDGDDSEESSLLDTTPEMVAMTHRPMEEDVTAETHPVLPDSEHVGHRIRTVDSLARLPGMTSAYKNLLRFYDTTKSYTPVRIRSSIDKVEARIKWINENYVFPTLSNATDHPDSWLMRMDHYTADKLDSMQQCLSSIGGESKKVQGYLTSRRRDWMTPWLSMMDVALQKTETAVNRVLPEDSETITPVNEERSFESAAATADRQQLARMRNVASSVRRRLRKRLYIRMQRLHATSREELVHPRLLVNLMSFAQEHIGLQKRRLQKAIHQNMLNYTTSAIRFNESLVSRRQEILRRTRPIVRKRVDELGATIQFFYRTLKAHLPKATEVTRVSSQQSLKRFLSRLDDLRREFEKETSFYETTRAKRLMKLAEEGIAGLQYITTMALNYIGSTHDESTTKLSTALTENTVPSNLVQIST